MAAPALPCDSCGTPIGDADLESGQAIYLLGKRYCAGCKSEAIQNVSLDDLSGKSPPAESVPPRKPAVRPPAARSEAAPSRRQSKAVPRKPAGRPNSSRTPLIAGTAVFVVLLGLGGFFTFRGSTPPEREEPRTPSPGAPAARTSPAPGPDRDPQARAAYTKVEEVSRRPGASADLLLAAIDQARPACRGTEWEKLLEDLRARTQKDKEREDVAKDLSPLIDELKGAVATDSEFKRYSELQPKFQLAIETAGRTASARMAELRALQRDYNSRYDKLAEPYYVEISEAANALAEERRYDDALRKIDTFPPQFRNSGSWTVLQKLKQDIERRKKQLPMKK